MVCQQDCEAQLNEYNVGLGGWAGEDTPDVCCNLIRHEVVERSIVTSKYPQLLELISSILVKWLRGYYVLLAVLVMKPD